MNKSDKVLLPALDLNQQLGYSTQIIQRRNNGIRIETQKYQQKNILHNYGYSASQDILAYSCSIVASQMLHRKFPKHKSNILLLDVAIIGAGFPSMFTALYLIKRGYSVTIYSEQFPTHKQQSFQLKNPVSSKVNGGVWFPMQNIHLVNYPDLDNFLYKGNFQYLQRLQQNKTYRGIHKIKGYSLGSKLPKQINEELIINTSGFVGQLLGDKQISYIKRHMMFLKRIQRCSIFLQLVLWMDRGWLY